MGGRAAVRERGDRAVGRGRLRSGVRLERLLAPARGDLAGLPGSAGEDAGRDDTRALRVMRERRRKHWGWGFEDEQPGAAELREAAAGLAAHLGFGSAELEAPAPARAARRRGSSVPAGLR